MANRMLETVAKSVRLIGELVCLRCGHRWWPRSGELPSVCPRCKSPYWNRPRRASKSGAKVAE